MQRPLQDVIERLHVRFSRLDEGEVATYIPELGRADPGALRDLLRHRRWRGCTPRATPMCPFTIQSISKPFVYGLALEDRGVDAVMAKVGVEPSGEAFNAISLEPGHGTARATR